MNQEKKTITYNKKSGKFKITIEFPRNHSGAYTYSPKEKWTMPFLTVLINKKSGDGTLNTNNYLDYKNSLQASSNVLYFFEDSEGAEAFAKKYGINIEYVRE